MASNLWVTIWRGRVVWHPVYKQDGRPQAEHHVFCPQLDIAQLSYYDWAGRLCTQVTIALFLKFLLLSFAWKTPVSLSRWVEISSTLKNLLVSIAFVSKKNPAFVVCFFFFHPKKRKHKKAIRNPSQLFVGNKCSFAETNCLGVCRCPAWADPGNAMQKSVSWSLRP